MGGYLQSLTHSHLPRFSNLGYNILLNYVSPGGRYGVMNLLLTVLEHIESHPGHRSLSQSAGKLENQPKFLLLIFNELNYKGVLKRQ